MENQKCETKGCRVTFYSIAFFYFMHYAVLGTFVPFAGYFFKERGFSGTEIGILLAVLPINRFFFTSMWTDRFTVSKHKTFFLSAAILSSTTIIFLLMFFRSFYSTAVILFIFSLTRTGIVPVIDTTAMNFGEKHSISYGRMRLFGSIGFILSSLLSGYFLDSSSNDTILYLVLILGLLSIIPVKLIGFAEWSGSKKTKAGDVLSKDFLLVVLALMIYLASFSFHGNFFNVKVDEAGLSQSYGAYMWSAGVAVEIVFMYISAHFFKFMTARNLTALSMLAGGLRAVLIAFSDDVLVLFIASSLHGMAFGTFHIGILAYIRKIMPKEKYLKAQSIYSGMGFGMGFILGSVASGVLFDYYGVNNVFLISAFMSLASAGVIMFCKNE